MEQIWVSLSLLLEWPWAVRDLCLNLHGLKYTISWTGAGMICLGCFRCKQKWKSESCFRSCLSICSAKSGDGWENSPHQSSLPCWPGRSFAFLMHLHHSQLRKGRIVKDSAAINLWELSMYFPFMSFKKKSLYISLIWFTWFYSKWYKCIWMHSSRKICWAVLFCMRFATSLQFSSIKVT